MFEVMFLSDLKKISKKLEKAFGGGVEAHEDGGRLILSGELEDWGDVVRAGEIAVDKGSYIGLINDIVCTGAKPSAPRRPELKDDALSGESPDVLIIGGGIVGCAIARELSRFNLDVLLVEKEHDLAIHASGRSDGVVHSGVDLKKGSLKYHYNMLGSRMFGTVCDELDVEFDRCGQFICYESGLWKLPLYFSLIKWKLAGVSGVKVFGRKKLRDRDPAVSRRVGAALFVPSGGIVCPYSLTIAYAENAVRNGAKLYLDTFVQEIESGNGLIQKVTTNRGKIFPKIVVNAAGAFCEDISRMAGDRLYSIHAKKATSAVLDKKYSHAVASSAIYTSRVAHTKKKRSAGSDIIRTLSGNALVKSEPVETIEKEDYSTSKQSVAGALRGQGRKSASLADHQVITYFSGIQASTYEDDFVVCKGKNVRNIVHAAGIQSPGLTAAPAIGVDVARMVIEMLGADANASLDPGFNPVRKAPPRVAQMDYAARAQLINSNPDYGVIVCRCEEISKGEVLDALRRDVPCDTIDGVKRRARPGMGRCQGGFCGPQVLEIIAKEKGLALSAVGKESDRSELLLGRTKQARAEGEQARAESGQIRTEGEQADD